MIVIFLKKIENKPLDFPLSEYKKEKFWKTTNEKRKTELIEGERLLIYGLKNLGINFSLPLSIEITEFGKPYLIDKNLFFSLSHSKNYIACSISISEIGLDIEEVEEKKYKIEKKLFTEFEEKSKEKDLDYVYKLWTIKEAYTKLIGTGLITNLKDINTKYVGIYGEYNKYLVNDAHAFNRIITNLSVSVVTRLNDCEIVLREVSGEN